MVWLYNLGIYSYYLGIWFAAPFSRKARLWIDGRKGWQQKMEAIPDLPVGQRWIWMHCSSLGEFEQGRPVLEAFKREQPGQPILLTFFSPSGYEIRKNYEQADQVLYLPLDTPANARILVEHFNPVLALFVKYDLWHHFLKELEARGTKTVLISGLFRPGQIYFKRYGGFFRAMLQRIDYFFLQNESSGQLLEALGIDRYEITGDTRIDRVAQLAHHPLTLPQIEAFCAGKKVFIAGSTWPTDLEVIVPFLQTDLGSEWIALLAPHKVDESAIKTTEQRLGRHSSIRYTNLKSNPDLRAPCLIVNTIGILSSLYALGTIAYIGGGFNRSGIHNTLEPAVFGLPILFGPNYKRFEEAVTMVERKAAFSVSNSAEFKACLSELQQETNRAEASAQASRFIQESTGATSKVMHTLKAKGWWPPDA